MNLENLRIFAEVVRTGGFSKAAEHLNVSKGFVSQQVKQLEKALNKQLLLRNTRNMRLTSSGELVYQQALKLTTFWQETAALVNEKEDEIGGEVRCTAPVAVAGYLLKPWSEQILTKHPDLRLSIESGNTTHNLVQKDFDFAIRLTNTPPEDMVARKLTMVQYHCSCSNEYAETHGVPKTPGALQTHNTLVLNHWKQWNFSQQNQTMTIELQPRFSASDNEVLKQMCLAGFGIGRFPDYMVKEHFKRGELQSVLSDFKGETRGLYLIYPQMSNRPARVSLAIEMLFDLFANTVDK